MSSPFDYVARGFAARRAEREKSPARRLGRMYRCDCGRPIFFDNVFCLGCHATLGFVPELGEVRSFVPGPSAGQWRLGGDGGTESRSWRPCANRESPAGCNWMVEAASAEGWCLSCRLNRTIPDLGVPGNGQRWHQLEAAKRRLVAQLLELGLPVVSRADDPTRGLVFDFLGDLPGQPRVMTGHEDGLITINIEEADDAVREKIRAAMREPYRTLLGHFRHEVGHYYWDRLIAPTFWLERFRWIFGDERADYQAALQRSYVSGPPSDWALRHVTAYASVHPWEDWAETWAHYLNMVDAINTALGFGLGGQEVDFNSEPFTREALCDPTHAGADSFLALVNSWVELTAVLNEIARSMGLRDLNPFVLSRTAVTKLHFVHLVVEASRTGPAKAPCRPRESI